MVAVRVVQHAVDQVVGMIPMRNRGVAAVRPMSVAAAVGGRWAATLRIRTTDFEPALVYMAIVIVVHVSVVQVVDVAAVANRDVTTVGAVVVAVSFVRCMRHGEAILRSMIQQTMKYTNGGMSSRPATGS